MVQRRCVGGPIPACPPSSPGGAGTFFDGATRLEEIQEVLVNAMAGTTFNLGGFVLPDGENIVFNIWATLSAANAFPGAQAASFACVAARDDAGNIILETLNQVSQFGDTVLDAAQLDVTGDVVSLLMDKVSALDAEYCLQFVFAPCTLQSVVLPEP